MSKEVKETLKFSGYVLEDRSLDIPEIKGVYCAYACSKNTGTGNWVLRDIVYFGKSEEGDSSIRARVVAHKVGNDKARSTLMDGEKLAYAYAATEEPDVCEKALVAAHKDLPRLANDKLTNGYKGPSVELKIIGKAQGMKTMIAFSSAE